MLSHAYVQVTTILIVIEKTTKGNVCRNFIISSGVFVRYFMGKKYMLCI